MFPQVSGTRERGSGETHDGGVWRLPPNSREIRGGRGAGGVKVIKIIKIYIN